MRSPRAQTARPHPSSKAGGAKTGSATTRNSKTRGVELSAPAPAASRERLLNEGSQLFLTGGYQGVGIAEICASANVQKGTFYHFFESKTHLLLEVIARRVREIEQGIERIADRDATASRKIIALFTMAQPAPSERAQGAMPPGYFLGNIVLEMASHNPPVQAATRSAFASWIKSISKIVDQLIAEEKLVGLDSEDAAEAILGLLQGGAVMANAYNDPRKMRAFAHTALTLLRAIGSDAKRAGDR